MPSSNSAAAASSGLPADHTKAARPGGPCCDWCSANCQFCRFFPHKRRHRSSEQSVCRPYDQDVRRFSQCTVKAQALFGKLCDDLTRQDDSSWQLPKYRTMYCAAAVGYRPMIAEITDAKQNPVKLTERACNQAILAAMGSEGRSVIRRAPPCAKVFP